MKLKCSSNLRWNSHCGHGRKTILNYGIYIILQFLYHIIKAQYTLRTHHITKIEEEFFGDIHDLSSQELLKYIKLCKYENYFNDYFKGDVLYEELKRRYNISTTNSENEIVNG